MSKDKAKKPKKGQLRFEYATPDGETVWEDYKGDKIKYKPKDPNDK